MIFSSQQMLANINMAGGSMAVYIHGRHYMAVNSVLCGIKFVTMAHSTLFKSLLKERTSRQIEFDRVYIICDQNDNPP